MPHQTTQSNQSTPPHTPPYDRDSIFNDNGPLNPSFMREGVRAMFRTLPLDPAEPKAFSDRRMHAALLALSALHPRDEIEVMLGVQAMAAHHAALACFRIGMNVRRPNGDSTRHITAACSAARTFDTMLRALERRQAKPLAVPIGRPASRTWDDAPHPSTIIDNLAKTVRADADKPNTPPDPAFVWTPKDLAVAEALKERDRIEAETKGLDIANTEGILPCGGMIFPENATPQQEAYMGRRLTLMYKREYEANLSKGIKEYPKIRGIRPGDLIP
jgi:hypothetical protein